MRLVLRLLEAITVRSCVSRGRSNRYFQSSLSARSGQRHEAGLPISLSVAMMPSRIRVGPTCVRSRPANIAAVADRAIGAATLPMHPVLPSVSLPLNGLSSLEEPASPHRRQRCRTRRRRSCRRRLQHERDAYRRADPGGAGSGPSDPVQWARGSFRTTPASGAASTSARQSSRGTRWDETRQHRAHPPCRESSHQVLCVASGLVQALDHLHTVEVVGSSPASPTSKVLVRMVC